MRSELDHDSPFYRMRHSLAHILAQAVMEYRPGKLGFGPPTESGFYYDFLLPEPITQEDLPAIEVGMRKIIGQNQAFEFSAPSAAGGVRVPRRTRPDSQARVRGRPRRPAG